MKCLSFSQWTQDISVRGYHVLLKDDGVKKKKEMYLQTIGLKVVIKSCLCVCLLLIKLICKKY